VAEKAVHPTTNYGAENPDDDIGDDSARRFAGKLSSGVRLWILTA
jgi:hypothetical protein